MNGSVWVLRLIGRSVVLGNPHQLNFRFQSENSPLMHGTTTTVIADTEESFDWSFDKGPLLINERLLVATVVIATEDNLFILLHIHGELGVNEEDR